MHLGLRHIHKRKGASSQFAPYPHEDGWKRIIDRTTLVAGIVGPLILIPQIMKIFVTREASGISIFSWTLLAILGIPFIVYGFVHKEKVLVVTYLLFFVMNTLVIVGAFLYQ